MCWSHAIFGPAVVPRNRNLVYWAHIDSGTTHWTERWASRTKPAMIIANSHFVSKSVGTLFGDVPTSVIYCPVAPSESDNSDQSRAAVRRELGVAEDAAVIIQVSRMESWKGQMLHLEALSEIRNVPDWVCWIVGGAQRPDEHTYFANLCAKARAAGIADRVLLLGQRSDVPRLLKAADIFCQPNVRPEPFGIVFIEALSAGLPVVTTSMGGATEIVQKTCGILVPPNQPRALGGALRALIKNPEIRTMLGSHGPRRARELCDPEIQLNSLYAAFCLASDSPHAAAKISNSD
jgi:glycosyltransferase involved in cell wall biosynthesis